MLPFKQSFNTYGSTDPTGAAPPKISSENVERYQTTSDNFPQNISKGYKFLTERDLNRSISEENAIVKNWCQDNKGFICDSNNVIEMTSLNECGTDFCEEASNKYFKQSQLPSKTNEIVKSLSIHRRNTFNKDSSNNESIPSHKSLQRHQINENGDSLRSYGKKYGLDTLTNAAETIKDVRSGLKDRFSFFLIWSKDFKIIEGHFGSAILSYFRFIRWIMFLNFFVALVMFFTTSFPTLLLTSNDVFERYLGAFNYSQDTFAQDSLNCSNTYQVSLKNDSKTGINIFLDILQGTGMMENTILFYGYYANLTYTVLNKSFLYNMSAGYLFAYGACFIVTFVLILMQSGAVVANHSSGRESVTKYTNMVLAGWDFCISNPKKANLKNKNILYEFNYDLAEQRRRSIKDTRTLKQRLQIYFIRFFINFVVLLSLASSLGVIYVASDSSLKWALCKESSSPAAVNLAMQYLPSITITVVNLIFPFIFNSIVSLENYSPSIKLFITLIRIVTLRISSLVILIISLYDRLFNQSSKSLIYDICLNLNVARNDSIAMCGNRNFQHIKCWETYIGQQIFKLVFLDFIVVILKTFVFEFPRKVVYVTLSDKFRIIRFVGMQQFDLPANVLDLVYSQCIVWFGTFFSPLIPAITTIKCLVLFYIKKLSLLKACDPPDYPYRESKSHSFFNLILLISFIVSAIGVGYTVGNFQPSQSCGPFRFYSKSNFMMIDVTWNVISLFPSAVASAIFFLASPTFIIPVILLLCFTIYLNWAYTQAHRSKADWLKEELAAIGRDKQYLLAALRKTEDKIKANRNNKIT